MKKLDIYGGLLGAGKTTLIRKMLTSVYQGCRVAIIENEIGRVNLDAQEFTNVQVRPLTSGCVCCTLKGDMIAAVKELIQTVNPDYLIIEATGAADLQAIKEICNHIKEVQMNRCIMLVNAKKFQALQKVVGEFYYMQIRQASTIYLNFTEGLTEEMIQETAGAIRSINPNAHIVSVPLSDITKDTFPEAAKGGAGQTSEASFEREMPSKTKYQLEVKDVTDQKPHIMSSNAGKTTLYTWTYEVKKPFTEEELEKFWESVKNAEIWRVKGIVSMADGTTRKLDYTFGDIFETEKDPENVFVKNKIVFIGRKVNKIK
jgi:G3E family GTPase